MTAAEWMDWLDRFGARVATLTPAEFADLVTAHDPRPDLDGVRQHYGELRYAMEFSRPEWFALFRRAYEIARPFTDQPAYAVIIEVALVLACWPRDPAVADALLSSWRAVIPDEQLEVVLPTGERLSGIGARNAG